MEPARAHSTRPQAEGRRGNPSDLTDAQWQVIAAHLPPDRAGRRVWPLRQIIEAILYLDRTGCAWRYLPSDFPPWQTVYWHFAAWRDDGIVSPAACRHACKPGRWPGSAAVMVRFWPNHLQVSMGECVPAP
jgi:transposase